MARLGTSCSQDLIRFRVKSPVSNTHFLLRAKYLAAHSFGFRLTFNGNSFFGTNFSSSNCSGKLIRYQAMNYH